MKRSEAYPSSYLAQDDVRETPIRATIADVRIETIGTGERADEKPVIHFREDIKTFVLNQTNWQTIEDAYGPESDRWGGKVIELYHDPGVKFGLEKVGGVRVRIPSAENALPWEEAVAQAKKIGMTEDDFKAALKARGLKGYNPVRDAAMVREILAERSPGGAVGNPDDTIPF